ncbi:MAG: hypothetical protein ACYTDW_01240 [Planctomycetota bacterium]
MTDLQYRYDSIVHLKQSYKKASNSDVFVTPTISPTPLENPESNIHDLYRLDTLLAYNIAEIIEDDELASYIQQEQETVTTLPAELSSNGIETTETPSDQGIEKTFDTKITDTPAEQVLTKIRTKIKYVETILKKAVIEPYQINGQIEGLQINGLDKILVAKDLLLKSGDIIRTVNGHSLKSKKRAYEVFKRARKLPIMEIELLRDGKSRILLYDLK